MRSSFSGRPISRMKVALRIEDPITGQSLQGTVRIMSYKKILIVDDDSDVRKGLHVRLTANHYETSFATDALSSLVEARKHKPDLIILDLGLPAGDGFLVMERLRTFRSLAVIPIVVVSGRDPCQNRERALRAGAKAFLRKPVDNGELLAVIRRVLGEPLDHGN
jgi:DNA-binding response OmpR family regulator